MKCLSEQAALARLEKIKTQYRAEIRTKYESKAKSCLTCEAPGACCVDEHFVNVHVTRLEARAIVETLGRLDDEKQAKIFQRAAEAIEKYNLMETGDTFAQTFACPLYEKTVGCMAHVVKPVPCIQHACYERPEDLPPDELQTATEAKIERLNAQTYRRISATLPLPVWLVKLNSAKNFSAETDADQI